MSKKQHSDLLQLFFFFLPIAHPLAPRSGANNFTAHSEGAVFSSGCPIVVSASEHHPETLSRRREKVIYGLTALFLLFASLSVVVCR